ncbi:MAG: hypothetical protein HYR66_02055 [Sphingobacteriales bacterium]|nr:hypothetical protein [Sphingobacteriales bacterium]MBI3719010.1 hypothetical protein [Sphingobacteriales bacterium]
MDAKTIAWLSYITIIGWIVAIVQHSNMPQKSSLAVFHLRQSFGLLITWIACYIVGIILVIATLGIGSIFLWILYLAIFVLWILGLISAINGEEKPVPVLGDLYQKWFTFIK